MTTRAEGREVVGGGGSVKGGAIGRNLAITRMAVNTGQCLSVVARVVTACARACCGFGFVGTVIKCVSRPTVCCMTGVALYRGLKMPISRLGRRTAVCTVARFANAGSARIVNPSAADEGGGGVAIAAIPAGRQVGRVGFIVLADNGRTTIDVARIAPGSDGQGAMHNDCRDEATGGMTDATILIRLNMANFFTLSENTVMAGLAVIHDAGMIECRRFEARSLVTHAAIVVGRHMVAVFSFGDNTIVTCRTVAYDSLVIEPGAGKGRGVMADGAVLRGGEMIHRLDGRDCHRTVVARRAVINDARVTEHRGGKATGHVTDAAILSGRDVADMLLGHRPRGAIAMTFRAVIHSAGMIKTAVLETAANAMARPAISGRHGMKGRLSQGPGRNIVRTAVMARGAIIEDALVREDGRCERHVGVAEVAILARGQVTRRLQHTRRRGEELGFVAALATRGVIRVNIAQENGRGKAVGRGVHVTLAALSLRGNVIHLLAQGNGSVMA